MNEKESGHLKQWTNYHLMTEFPGLGVIGEKVAQDKGVTFKTLFPDKFL